MHPALSRPERNIYLQLRTKFQNRRSAAVAIRYLRTAMFSILRFTAIPHAITSPIYIPARMTESSVLQTPVTISYFAVILHPTAQITSTTIIDMLRISFLFRSDKAHHPLTILRSRRNTGTVHIHYLTCHNTVSRHFTLYPDHKKIYYPALLIL